MVLGALALCPRAGAAEPDLRAQANGMLAVMEGDAHRVAVLLQHARAAHAPGPIQCVDGYLSQVDTDVRYGRDDVRALRAALAAGDRRTAQRALLWLSSRREAARSASFAADACITPSLATARDETTVRVVAPNLPSDPTVFAR